jgi:hypothetical protein
MNLAPVPPCVLFHWWSSHLELWVSGRLTLLLPPWSCTPLQLLQSLLQLLPSGIPCSVQWFAASICLCICKALSGPLRRQLYQAPNSAETSSMWGSTILWNFTRKNPEKVMQVFLWGGWVNSLEGLGSLKFHWWVLGVTDGQWSASLCREHLTVGSGMSLTSGNLH